MKIFVLALVLASTTLAQKKDQAESIKKQIDEDDSLIAAVESGYLTTSSSVYMQGTGPEQARLYYPNTYSYANAWAPDFGDSEPWIQVNLIFPRLVKYIAFQGKKEGGENEYAQYFTVMYTLDGKNWINANKDDKPFTGLDSGDKIRYTKFEKPFLARAVRIYP